MTQLTRISKNDVKEFGYATAEEAVWTCETCGETVPAKYLQPLNRHIRGSCKCQRDEFAAHKRRERDEMERSIRMERLRYTYSWMGREFAAEQMSAYTFDNFQEERQPDASATACMWSTQPTGTLIFHGNYGTGKSHLMAAICNVLRERGRKCRWVTAPKLFQAMSHAMDEANRLRFHGDYVETWTDIARKAANADILFLDDVDKLKGSEWREEVYHSILDDRITAGKPTALTINNLDRLGECMGESVADRLYVGRIAVAFGGESFRKGLAYS